MPDPVLRIPVDDEAFKRYIAAFQRYQEQLDEQPEMWHNANEATRDGIAANLALADAIGASVAAAERLGVAQDRNAQKRRRDAQQENADAQRASDWRRKSLDHVQELSRTTSSVVRNFSNFAAGGQGTGGLFGMIADAGKGIGGTFGGIVSLAGHVLNAGYEINNAVSDKGQFARGIGASVSEQEGFHNNLGRYTNTDQGIDAVMNARGDPAQWAQFNMLGVKGYRGDKSNAQVYADVLRAQVELARRHTHGGHTDWYAVDPRGGSAFGTSHEDLNRLMKAPDLNKAIQDAASFKSSLGDKEVDAATKSATAMDTLTTRVTDAAQAFTVGFDPALDKATKGLADIATLCGKIVGFFPSGWFSGGADAATAAATSAALGGGAASNSANDEFKKRHPWLAAIGFGISGGTGPDRYAPHALDELMAGVGDTPKSTDAANDGLHSMRGRAEAAIVGMGSHVTSRVRSYAEQARLYERYLAGKGPKAAPPGHSEHEAGRALDFALTPGMDRAAIRAALTNAGVNFHSLMYEQGPRGEGKHWHVGLGAPARKHGEGHANVNVKVSVTAPPGHQTAVVANSAARGG